MAMWYAIQIGDCDNDCGTGSHDYDEAEKMAKNFAEQYPNEEIRIVTCTDDDDFCLREEIFQKAKVD